MPDQPTAEEHAGLPRHPLLRIELGPEKQLRRELLARGVEFPCGGEGTCGHCRLRVREGSIAATPDMEQALTRQQLDEGWRLGCLAEAQGSVLVEVGQWFAGSAALARPAPRVLVDAPDVPHAALTFEAREGYAAVVDVGTTTLVAQLIDRRGGAVLHTATAWNPQARWGADVMSRVRHELRQPGELSAAIRTAVAQLIVQAGEGKCISEVLLVGNTVMHHLFGALPVDALAQSPFRSPHMSALRLDAADLGWPASITGTVQFLPPVGGFVGSDLLAGLFTCGLDMAGETTALLDLGTNGEIALATGGAASTQILCASTAAGPAFEAANISCGMRAEPGAIHRVRLHMDSLCCDVLGDLPAKGICGSGLLDAVACALDAGSLHPNGRIGLPRSATTPAVTHSALALTTDITLSQRDIRELQLAKAAIASGLVLLENEAGARARRLFLAGAFGNYLRISSARRIGLLPGAGTVIEAAGNAALRGARLLLLAPTARDAAVDAMRARCRHVELASLAGFQDAFVDALVLESGDADGGSV